MNSSEMNIDYIKSKSGDICDCQLEENLKNCQTTLSAERRDQGSFELLRLTDKSARPTAR